MADSRSASDSRAETRPENSLWGSARRTTKAAAPPAESQRRAKPRRSDTVPEEVKKRFVQSGNKYYFPDGARAFTDRGQRLTTPSENTEVVKSLVDIARARGWSEITVRGTERFRKDAWVAARLAGIEVRGYIPSEFEQGHLVRTLRRQAQRPVDNDVEREGAAPQETARRPRSRAELLTGRLADHGRATYGHDPRASMSYFVKLETSRGDRVVWGVDLERALKESLSKPQLGDEVALRSVARDAVTVKARDPEGKLTEREVQAHRNRWIVEKREFFDSRAEAARTVRDASVTPKQAVKQHPELVGTYLQVHAAELAAKRFRDPEDRKLFVEKVRASLADAVARGEPLPAVRLRERTNERLPKSPAREPAPVRG
jgi:hypothetical protein